MVSSGFQARRVRKESSVYPLKEGGGEGGTEIGIGGTPKGDGWEWALRTQHTASTGGQKGAQHSQEGRGQKAIIMIKLEIEEKTKNASGPALEFM